VIGERQALGLLLVILAILTMEPLLRSGYTTADDLMIALRLREGDTYPWLYNARITGRLGHAVTVWLQSPAYGFGEYWLSKALSIGALISNVAAMCLAVRLITDDRRLAVLAATLYFAFVQNSWEHNLLTSFPLIVPLAVTCFWLAVAAWWVTVQQRGRYGAVSALLFLLTLPVYEIFLVYTAIFPMLSVAASHGAWRARARAALRTPHVYMALGWLVAAALFKAVMQTGGGRQMMASELYTFNLNPPDVWRVVWQYAVSSLPAYFFRSYRYIIYDIYLGFGGFRGQLTDLTEIIEAAWIGKALIVGFLVAMLTRRPRTANHRGLVLAIGLVIFWLTNLPLAGVTKYQQWIMAGSVSYLPGYVVFFGTVILLTLLADAVIGACGQRPRAARAAAITCGVVAGVLSWGVDFANAHVAFAQHRMFYKWAAVEAWAGSPAFKALPAGSLVLAPTLFENNDAGTHVFEGYWTRYVRQISGKSIEILQGRTEWEQRAAATGAADRLYYLKFAEEKRRLSLFVVFGRVDGSAGPLETREALVLTRSRARQFQLFGRLMHVQAPAAIVVDGHPSDTVFREEFAASVDKPAAGDGEWLWTTVSATGAALDPMSIFLSDYPASVAVTARGEP
jgi:hypothetical protein